MYIVYRTRDGISWGIKGAGHTRSLDLSQAETNIGSCIVPSNLFCKFDLSSLNLKPFGDDISVEELVSSSGSSIGTEIRIQRGIRIE